MTDLDSTQIKLLNCDCMEYMRSLPDNAFQLAVYDPPYGINIGNGLGNGRKDYKTHKSWQMCSPGREYFDELRRVSRNQIIWGGNYFTDVLPPCDNWIIWDKKNPGLTFSEAELAWCSVHRKIRIFARCTTARDVCGRIHPTQKPVELYRWLLRNYAQPGDRILDTHLGSGSSAIAAYDLGFDFVGTEIDETYYDAAVKRFSEYASQKRLEI